jgi:hypothetical protein
MILILSEYNFDSLQPLSNGSEEIEYHFYYEIILHSCDEPWRYT